MRESYLSSRSRTSSSPVSQFGNNKQKANQLKDFYQLMNIKYEEMQTKDSEKAKKQQKELMKKYIKVLDKVGGDLLEAQNKYKNIDKDVLKIDKLLYLSEQLNFFRTQSHKNNNKVLQNKRKADKLKQQNQFLQKQIKVIEKMALQKQMQRKALKKHKMFVENRNLISRQFFSLTKDKINLNNQSYYLKKQNNEQDFQQQDMFQNKQQNEIPKLNRLRLLKKQLKLHAN